MTGLRKNTHEPKTKASKLTRPCKLKGPEHNVPLLKDRLLTTFLELFEQAPQFDFRNRPVYSTTEKQRNEEGIRQIMESLEVQLKPWRRYELSEITNEDASALERVITSHLLQLDQGRHLFDEPFLEFFIEQGYLASAQEFFRMARENDGDMSVSEFFQALRNLWIINSLQLLWNLPLEVTSSGYAYSMLYPYTDNFLDDPTVPSTRKQQFNEKLTRLIEGEAQTSDNIHESRVFELLAQIECQYPPRQFPMVFEALQMIQDAQIQSLRQDQAAPLNEWEITQLCFYKGGASVYADACLLSGKLSVQEVSFAFGYGTFLQLVDDLQDAVEDQANGHQTLFTTESTEVAMDQQVLKLIAYIDAVNEPLGDDLPITSYMKNIINTCTNLMIKSALGQNPHLISNPLYQKLEACSKVHLDFFATMKDIIPSLASDFDSGTLLTDLPVIQTSIL